MEPVGVASFENKISFTPHKLKTLEVDTTRKVTPSNSGAILIVIRYRAVLKHLWIYF